jgi:hypothetical protein
MEGAGFLEILLPVFRATERVFPEDSNFKK